MDCRFVACVFLFILIQNVTGREVSPAAIRHVHLFAEQGRKTLSAPATVSASEQSATANIKTANDCSDEVQQIECYYDSARSAIVGVQYTLRNSRAKRQICNTSGQPGSTVRLRKGVGVTKLTVRSKSDQVVGIEFKLSTGRTPSCKVVSRTASDTASSNGGRASATAASSTAAASNSVSANSIITDYLNNYPYKISGGNHPSSPPPDPPNPPDPRPHHRSRIYAGPSAAYTLGGLNGVCSAGSPAGSLQAITEPCWAKAALEPSPSPPTPPPRPSPTPSTKPPTRPSPRPPKPSPTPSTSPKPNPQGPDGHLSVTLFSRGQTACGLLGSGAPQGLGWYLGKQLLLLGLGGFSVKQDGSECPCSVVQGVPMYACQYLVQGPSSSQWNGPAAASYLAASVTAAGQQICNGAVATNLTSVCSNSAQVTGLCAASTSSSSSGMLSCTVAQGPPPWQMAVLLGIPTAACSSNVSMTSNGVSSLVQHLSGFLPGFAITVPTWATNPLKCSSAQANAYYQVSAVTISPGSQLDVQGAAEFLSATLNQQQPGPCSGSSSSASSTKPAFCSELPQPPVMCATANYTATSVMPGCPSAGASFNVLFTNPSDGCSQGNPPPDAIRSSLDTWWRQQLDYLANGKLFNATTVPPGSATAANGSCLYRYKVMVYGPNNLTPQQIDDMALNLMSSALMFKPVPCATWQGADFCKYFAAATFCAALAPATC